MTDQEYLKMLQDEVERKAKRANQRLRQLEKSGVTESSRAYQVTVRKVSDNMPGYVKTAKGNIAFDRRLKDKTIAMLEAELEDLDKFLGAHTATVKGYKSQLRQSYEGFLESTGMNEAQPGEKSGLEKLSFKEYQQLFTMKATEHFGYSMILKIQRETGKDLNTIEKALQSSIKKEIRDGEALGQKNLIERVEHPERFRKDGSRRKGDAGRPKKSGGKKRRK